MALSRPLQNDDLICPICFELFTSPKYLPCHHTFCLSCLNTYIVTQSKEKLSKPCRSFPCPVCRLEVKVSDANLPKEKIAETFPDKKSTGSEGFEKFCGPCNVENKTLIATTWCTVCLDAMCENCTVSHKRFKSCTNHATVPIENMSKEQEIDLYVDERCLHHEGKTLEVYCLDHGQMCCVICLATQHRKCEHVSTFEEMITNPKSLETVDNFTEFLNKIDEKTYELKVQVEENIRRMDHKQGEISKKVSIVVQKAKDKLDKLKTNFLLKFTQTHKIQNTKLTERKERIESFLYKVRAGKKILQLKGQEGSPKQVFIIKEKLKSQLHDQFDRLKKDFDDTACIDYTMDINDMVASIPKSVTSLAEVNVKRTRDFSDNITGIIDIMDSLYNGVEHLAPAEKSSLVEPDTSLKLTISRICSVGNEGNFSGGTFLPDGRLVLCNSSLNELQAYDKTGKLLFETTVPSVLRDVCCVGPSQIIVSVQGGTALHKYKVTQKEFRRNGEIGCGHEPWGLAAAKGKLVVGYMNEIAEYSFDGTFIQLLTTRKGLLAPYVGLSTTGNVYFGDGDEVVCTDENGKKVTRYKDQQLKSPLGIAVDGNGNVLVCGWNSNKIFVFSADGKSKTLIDQPYIECPVGIGFDSRREHIFIATAYCVHICKLSFA